MGRPGQRRNPGRAARPHGRSGPRARDLALGLLLLGLGGLLAGCTGAQADPSASQPARVVASPTATGGVPTATASAGGSTSDLVAARPYRLVEPPDTAGGGPAPLIVVLHGYGQEIASDAFHLDPLAKSEGALVVHPPGTPDVLGRRFWNATDVCCDFFAQGVDDVAYLRAVIDDVSAHHDVDPKRVYVVGYSNGAFMAQRLACDLADRVAAIVSISGVNFLDPAACQPSEHVAVLQVHGDADPVVQYLGGRFGTDGALYPSVTASIEGWRDRNECAPTPEVEESAFDLAPRLAGAETAVTRYEGCAPGGAAELWTVHGGSHDIEFSAAFASKVWGFLEEHARG
ncbi:MAG: dienelactone hydrolase family protein [Dehalococcoidia bacterium]|nr:dienelactone hydrolase family protein [Dehalococcoidia bacterium]